MATKKQHKKTAVKDSAYDEDDDDGIAFEKQMRDENRKKEFVAAANKVLDAIQDLEDVFYDELIGFFSWDEIEFDKNYSLFGKIQADICEMRGLLEKQTEKMSEEILAPKVKSANQQS